MEPFNTLYRAGITKRWHTHDTLRQQSVAEHSWGVAMICIELMPDSLNLVKAALYHDLAESYVGDVPYPAKRDNPALKGQLDAMEETWEVYNGIDIALTEKEVQTLRWADMYEAWLFARREVRSGNEEMVGVMKAARTALFNMPVPCTRALEMYREEVE